MKMKQKIFPQIFILYFEKKKKNSVTYSFCSLISFYNSECILWNETIWAIINHRDHLEHRIVSLWLIPELSFYFLYISRVATATEEKIPIEEK